MIYCKHCGNEMNEGQRICLHCGMDVNAPVQKEECYCTHCGAPVQRGAAICTKCGFSLNRSAAGAAAVNISSNKLARSADGKVFAGVFSGLGKKLNVNPRILRLASIFLNFFGIGILIDIAYVIAIFALPMED